MIAATELALLARLRAMEPVLGFAWGNLLTLPPDWEAWLESKGVELRGPAAAWAGFTGWTATERVYADDGEQLIVDASFGLLLGSISARQDEEALRHGGPNPAIEPGSYRLAVGAASVLSGQMLGLDMAAPIEVGALQPMPRSAKMKSLNLSVHGAMLSCRLPIQLAGDESDEAALFAALHANWDVPEFLTPIAVDADLVASGVQLPDDAHADATDHIILQENP